MSLKLVVEKPDEDLIDQFEYVLEERNSSSPRSLFISGPYMMAEEVNRNKRVYSLEEMAREVARYNEQMIANNRALGELNHPTSAEVDPERACHMVTELTQRDNVFYGKSKVLSTPIGQVVHSLINDGVKLGMSSRALGQLTEQADGTNRVEKMRLVAIDCVADPSYPKAFVNGILESCEYVCNTDGTFEPLYDNFKQSISALPRKDVDSFLREHICNFLRNFHK